MDIYCRKTDVKCAYLRFLMYKTGFRVQNYLLNMCSSAVHSQRLLCNSKSWCEMFVLKFSCIQTLLSSYKSYNKK